MGLLPETSCDLRRINIAIVPPRLLISDLMQLPMVPTAQRHRELIADLETHRARLSGHRSVGSSTSTQSTARIAVADVDQGSVPASAITSVSTINASLF